MLDIWHLPEYRSATIRWFFAADAGSELEAQTYQIPRGASMVHFVLFGGGGGGGGGRTGAVGTARGGGGGGASGSSIRVILPTFSIPNAILITPGRGGPGGAANATGTAGASTYVYSLNPATTQATMICTAAGGNGGSPGLTTGGGGGGTAGASTGALCMSNFGIPGAVSGQSGSAGGTSSGAAGTSVTWGATQFINVSGGAGGAGVGTTNVDSPGGSITGAGFAPSIPGAQISGNKGNDGAWINSPWLTTGGTGGSSNGSTGVGGTGGNGAWGSGGGGGGAGVTGGTGGAGGGGAVMIATW